MYCSRLSLSAFKKFGRIFPVLYRPVIGSGFIMLTDRSAFQIRTNSWGVWNTAVVTDNEKILVAFCQSFWILIGCFQVVLWSWIRTVSGACCLPASRRTTISGRSSSRLLPPTKIQCCGSTLVAVRIRIQAFDDQKMKKFSIKKIIFNNKMSYISLLGFFDGHLKYWTSLHPPLENMKFIHVFFLLFCGSFWPPGSRSSRPKLCGS